MTEDRRNLREAVLEAIEALETLEKGRGRPNRYHARALLLPLGELLLSEGASTLDDLMERTRAVTDALGESWREAALGELALAAAEHIHAADPRYLGLENYDFAYTFRARERLEARLAAAGELDLSLPPGLQNEVRAADERLEPHLGRPPGKD